MRSMAPAVTPPGGFDDRLWSFEIRSSIRSDAVTRFCIEKRQGFESNCDEVGLH